MTLITEKQQEPEDAAIAIVAVRLPEALAEGDVRYVATDEQRADIVTRAPPATVTIHRFMHYGSARFYALFHLMYNLCVLHQKRVD